MTKFQIYIIATLLVLSLLLAYAAVTLPDGQLHIFFLNIGQGDGILIRSPVGHNVIIDGGPGTKINEELSAVLPFYERQIDLLILTHPDQDHIEGAIEILKNYQVKRVLITGVISHSPFYQSFLEQIRQQQIPFAIASASTDYQVAKNLYLDILYPLKPLTGQSPSQPNNASVVFNLLYGEHRILFTGDIEKETEQQILDSQFNITADILKVAHHGSRTSSTSDFLQAASSKIAIIQSELGNRHGHPHSEILDRLQQNGVQKIYRNDLQGRIEIITNGSSLKVETQKTPPPKHPTNQT